MNTHTVSTGNAIDRAKAAVGAVHASDKVQLLSSVMLVSGIMGCLLLISGFFGLVSFVTTELPVAKGALVSVETVPISELKSTTPSVGTHVRISDALLVVDENDLQRIQNRGYATLLVTSIRRQAGGSGEGKSRVIYWEAPASLITSPSSTMSSRELIAMAPTDRIESSNRGVVLDGVVTEVASDAIRVIDTSRVYSVFRVWLNAGICVAEFFGGILLLKFRNRLSRARRVLLDELNGSQPLLQP